MKGQTLLPLEHPFHSFLEFNIYANKSSLIIAWLLNTGVYKEKFSLREVVKDTGVSIGLAQRTFEFLVCRGLLHAVGVKTGKRFFIKEPHMLLKSWLEKYNILGKCRIWSYDSRFYDKEELLKILQESPLKEKTALALHSAADAYGCKNTNLTTLELYITEPEDRPQLEKSLRLSPAERSYEVLLIEPYYKSLLKKSNEFYKNIKITPRLLTFLDLYYFPLRGIEQAEFMAERMPEIHRIYKKIY